MGDAEQTTTAALLNQRDKAIIVLVTGVVGGLGLIIVLILCFKHCIKKPPETGLDVEEYEEKISLSASFVGSPSSYHPVNMELTPIHERHTESSSPTDLKDLTGNIKEEDDRTVNNGWNELVVTETSDYYDRRYPEQNMKGGSKQWVLKRDSSSSQSGARSRPPSRVPSNGGANHGSHRNLQSSIESSVFTDNPSDVTVIEAAPSDSRIKESGIISSSTDGQHNHTIHMTNSSNQNYLLPCRPVPKRRQSTQTESRIPRERIDRLIKSQDESRSCYKLQKEDAITSDDNPCFNGHSYNCLDGIQNEEQSRSFHLQVPLPSRMNIELREAAMDGYLSPHDTTDNDNHSIASHNSSRSSRQLWHLRSTLGQQTSSEDEVIIGEEAAEVHVVSSDDELNEEINGIRDIVCNVVYTSCDSEDFFTDLDRKVQRSPVSDERRLPAENYLHPPEKAYSSKRRNYQQRRNRGATRYHTEGNSSTEKSFDSFDTATTDGARSSESSRVEATTTSFESSTTDSDTYVKRQQRLSFKGDSGYKSAETQFSPKAKTCITFALDEENKETDRSTLPAIQSIHQRTASKKRRDFQSRYIGIQKQVSENITTSCSTYEQDSTKSTSPYIDTFDDTESTTSRISNGKRKFFNKFFRYSSKSNRRQQSQRDYSIDEKSDALFREFNRYDPSLDDRNVAQRYALTLDTSNKYILQRGFKTLTEQVIPEGQDRKQDFPVESDGAVAVSS